MRALKYRKATQHAGLPPNVVGRRLDTNTSEETTAHVL